MPPNSDSKLITDASNLLVDAFEDYNARFADITRRAKRRFEARDVSGMHADTQERIELYDVCIRETFSRLEKLLADRLFSRGIWQAMRRDYGERVEPLLDAELYKTFFNTLSRRFFKTRGTDPALEFVALDIIPTAHITHPAARNNYRVSGNARSVCQKLLADYPFKTAYADLSDDAQRLATRLTADIQAAEQTNDKHAVVSIELLKTIFYRAGAAYLVGRVVGAQHYLPCVIALINTPDGVRVDALLTRHRYISVLFGYTHSAFHANLPTVGDAVVFLRTLLPHKPVDELYTALGRLKQGKTERYRQFFGQLEQHPDEQLKPAPGDRGLVMAVFTLPSYPLVFKVIRDKFGPTKPFGREQVIDRYHRVFHHTRVGRLVDAQEFRFLRFPLSQFSSALLEELRNTCEQTVEINNDTVTIRHCYVERRVTPLNLYLAQADEADAKDIISDYGQAICDLTHSNIFTGDLLLKNFGVTRTGRVVLYDYDEVTLVTDCTFRPIPPARSEEDEFNDQPWYAIETGDVFPEQFPRFMGLKPDYLHYLKQCHGELFDYRWWREQQRAIAAGNAVMLRPYPRTQMLD
ncbi:MAG TPA: bifunctional isocitrate dehydrogenase kinase/phosphatase [Gammaproteobacteria bacterium]|nr:bifunctional isocitrate dehydrogenase kinase/phosphatase [Gammaproteobacteria bacterium]